jgi:hypothetical protein
MKMLRKISLLLVVMVFMVSGLCWADSWEANLSAGNTSAMGGVHYKRELATGYMKTGVSGIYTDDNDLDYRWAEFTFAVGSENIQPGLTCEVGLKGILGDAEESYFSGDIGTVAFDGYAGYIFPRHVMPMPLEIFGGLSYAPEVLSFRDTEDFFSYRFGVGLRIVENASVILEYSAFDMDMEAGPGPWNLDDDVIRLGLHMRF